jgi:N utilization substance protein B
MSRRRHEAREAALQALYLCEVGGVPPGLGLETYFEIHGEHLAASSREFARRLVTGSLSEHDALDALVASHSHRWRPERMALLDRLILRLAAWELRHEPDVPPAVVIDEALELARTFSGDDAVRFVNGVLDGMMKAQADG